MGNLPERRGTKPPGVARPFPADVVLGWRRYLDLGVEKATDEGLFPGFKASRPDLGGFRPYPALPGLL